MCIWGHIPLVIVITMAVSGFKLNCTTHIPLRSHPKSDQATFAQGTLRVCAATEYKGQRETCDGVTGYV